MSAKRCECMSHHEGPAHARWCPLGTAQRHARNDSGGAILSMVRAMDRYVRAYKVLYDSDIATDGVLGPEVESILRSIVGLLNGELGSQDGGNLDRMVRDVARVAGITEEI